MKYGMPTLEWMSFGCFGSVEFPRLSELAEVAHVSLVIPSNFTIVEKDEDFFLTINR